MENVGDEYVSPTIDVVRVSLFLKESNAGYWRHHHHQQQRRQRQQHQQQHAATTATTMEQVSVSCSALRENLMAIELFTVELATNCQVKTCTSRPNGAVAEEPGKSWKTVLGGKHNENHLIVLQ